MIKTDKWIRTQVEMITPFIGEQRKKGGVISYGLSSAGYDIRVADEFQLFTNTASGISDPKAFDEANVIKGKTDVFLMPPFSFALARSVEILKIPRNIMAILKDKSTLARAGLTLLGGVLEPGWEGHVTLELKNVGPNPLAIYANEGIGQVLFMDLDGECDVSYADRKGKYQGQRGIVAAKVG